MTTSSGMRAAESEHCYVCGTSYRVLGENPAVCPECGSRAVSLIPPFRVAECRHQSAGDGTADRSDHGGILELILDDASDRLLMFYIDTTATPPSIEAIRYETVRFTPSHPAWSEDLVPQLVYDSVADEIGDRPVLAASST